MKLNGFENYIITEAVNMYKTACEKEIKENNAKTDGKRFIFAEGYYTTVCNDLLYKIDQDFTTKKYITQRDAKTREKVKNLINNEKI